VAGTKVHQQEWDIARREGKGTGQGAREGRDKVRRIGERIGVGVGQPRSGNRSG
jgi:hypothetical protein